MDINIFIFLTIMILLLTLLGLVKDNVEFAVFPGLAVILGLIFHTSLLADGSITELAGGTVTAIASASTAVTSVWQAIQYIPLVLSLGAALIAVYKVGKAF